MRIEVVLMNKSDIKDLKIICLFSFFCCLLFAMLYFDYKKIGKVEETKIIHQEKMVIPQKEEIIEITTAGDCTLGSDTNFGYNGEFDWWFKNKAKGDYGYFFAKVKDLFTNDDFSYVNLEGTLTTHNKKVPKAFNFKGNPSYTNILLEGNIEGVNLANNHTNDYGEIGYRDTKANLEKANINYFGYDNVLIKKIKGQKIAFVGYTGVGLWLSSDEEMARTIKYLKEVEKIPLVIANFHWGIEYAHRITATQRNRAHLAIDSGADIVIGSHPHCLQGMEEYKGKIIVYSLGNFVFGGNSNPKQIGRECLIVKMYFHFMDNKLLDTKVKIIPCSISSISGRNNFQPIPATGNEKKRLINIVNKYSINYKYIDEV